MWPVSQIIYKRGMNIEESDANKMIIKTIGSVIDKCVVFIVCEAETD